MFFNSKHVNIKFTSDLEIDGRLPFLDVNVTRCAEGGFTTDVYRKDTFTGLGLNYLSFVPQLFKVNSIKMLVFRAYNICCTWSNFDMEINRLKSFFTTNGYPTHLFESIVKRFLNDKLTPKPSPTNVVDQIKCYFTLSRTYKLFN